MKKSLFLLLIAAVVIGVGIYAFYGRIDHNNMNDVKEESTPVLVSNEVKNSIFKKEYSKAQEMVQTMTLEEKIGQLFLVRYDTSFVSEYNHLNPGGYILFAKDFENHTKESIKEELKKDQSLSKYPLMFGVDEEGGFVTRISRFQAFRSEKFSSPKEYYLEGGYDKIEETEREKAQLLKEIGISLNLAPVADVSQNPDDFIYNRSFGEDANVTSEFISKVVKIWKEEKENSCLKHFPGYGNNVDTHTGVAIDERDYDTFVNNDYLPFEAGIKAGVPSILVSHNIMVSVDPDYPSSLSEKVIKELRDKLSFTGIILTDDLAMDAVKSYVEDNHAATMAIKAGVDMIITSDFPSMYQEVLDSVNQGEIKEETINTAVMRIIAWKYNSNLFNEKEGLK